MVDGRDPALNHYLVGKAIVDCNLSIWQRVFIFTKTHGSHRRVRVGACWISYNLFRSLLKKEDSMTEPHSTRSA